MPTTRRWTRSARRTCSSCSAALDCVIVTTWRDEAGGRESGRERETTGVSAYYVRLLPFALLRFAMDGMIFSLRDIPLRTALMLSGHGDGFRDVWGREFGSGNSGIVGGIGVGHRRPGVAQLTLPEMEGFAVYLIDLARSQPIYSTRLPMCRCPCDHETGLPSPWPRS